MKVTEVKSELEKVSKIIPELRKELDDIYAGGPGKKRRLKLLWREYEDRYKEVRASKEYKNLQ